MKSAERALARELRSQGYSLGMIRKQLGVSKSSVSLWVRDIELTPEQIARLRTREVGRERYSETMRIKRELKIVAYHQEAEAEYAVLMNDMSFVFGLALYIGEGTKRICGTVAVANCDPRVIRSSIGFFLKVGVPIERVRCRITLHPGLSAATALAYWCQHTGLGLDHFCNVDYAVTRASQGKAVRRQPYGTCSVFTYSVRLYHKILRWMELALGGQAN